MSPSTPPPCRPIVAGFAAVASLMLMMAGPARADSVDDTTKGIWKLKYGVSDSQIVDTAWLAADSDGDGVKNGDEIWAGTNPFVPGSVLKITTITTSGGNVSVTFPSLSGKQYFLQGSTTVGGFGSIGTPGTGNGSPMTLMASTGSNKFFRVLVQDIDTDGDGVGNWAETAVGLNPALSESISGQTTLAYVNQQLALPNVVTIKATNSFASEDGPSAGTLTISRTQDLFPITVTYAVSGTAVPATDYTPLSGSVNFSVRGVTTQDVSVLPMAQATVKGSRSVTAALNAAGGGDFPFTLGSPNAATVIINPSTAATGTGLLARYYDTASSTQADAANFGQAGVYTFTRGSPTTNGTVTVRYNGSTIASLTSGNQVKLSFTSGPMSVSGQSANQNQIWTVSATTANSFTATITGAPAALSSTNPSTGSCNFNIQSFTHPAVITQVDPTVNFDWQYGTPNGAVIAPANSPENYSSTWECYLSPSTAGSYKFQIDADLKAEVLLDTGSGLVQIAEHNWNNPGADTVGTFKQGFTLTGCSTAAGNSTVTVPSTTGLAVGMAVSGTGLPANEFITAIGSGQITVTTGTGVTAQGSTALTFTGGVVTLAVPATPAQRYHMVVHHVETTGDARCRLQWLVPGATSYANIPQANQFTHTVALNTTSPSSPYSLNSSTNAVTITPPGGHSFVANDPVTLAFSSGILFTPGATTGSYNQTYNVATVNGTTSFTVNVTPFSIPVSGASTTAGSPFVTVPSTAGLAVGMAISGTGLPANEFITGIGIGVISVTTGVGVTTQGSTALTASLPTSGTNTGNGFILNNTASTTTGVYNLCYANTTFTGSPARVGTDTAVTAGNNGIWLGGTPDLNLIVPDSFSIRWTGQVQPQFTEDYTFVVQADDGVALNINGQPQILKMVPSASTSGATYSYDSSTGDITITYSSLIVQPSSFADGETIRLDLTSGGLQHTPATSPTYTYNGTFAIINYANLTNRVPGTYAVGEVVELDPTSGGLSSLANTPYVILGAADGAPDPTSNTFAVAVPHPLRIASISPANPCVITTTANHGLSAGNTVSIAGITDGAFTPSINGSYTVLTVINPTTFTVASNCTVSPTPTTGTLASTVAGNITINDTRNLKIKAGSATANSFKVNIGAGTYANSSGNINLDIVNKALKDWSSNGNERYVRIPMIGGVRYDIQLDYYENTGAAKCLLSWYSPSQPKQIIPPERLYPSNLAPTQIAKPAHISPTDAIALANGSFVHSVAGSNSGTVTFSNKPLWLSYDSNTGLLSGTPPPGAGGDYQILITITNSAGTSTSVLNLHVDENVGSVVREYWDGSTGTSVAGIPTGNAPTGSNLALTSLEAPNDNVSQRGARMRGYITAPTTGNYYFWVAASGAAELWISNDDEPINAFRRAYVSSPGSAVAQTWDAQSTQKSPWLALEQGKKYYFEVLHNTGAVTPSNLAIGWSKPGDSTSAPSQVVPGYALSPYVAPVAGPTSGTLFVATMLAQAGAVTNGVGSSNMRLAPDGNTAYIKFVYSGLTAALGSHHVHIDPNGPTHNDGEIVYDFDTPATPGDGLITNPSDPNVGAFKWTINSVGTYSPAQIREALLGGKAYINLHTANNPNGEIRGNYTLAEGTQTFTPPAAPPTWTDDSNTNAGATRFLMQATFGGNIAEISALKALAATSSSGFYPPSRYETWIDDQFTKTQTLHLPEVLAREIGDVFGAFDVKVSFDTWWKTSMTAQDQLRQRVAFALSEIHVVSGQGPLEDNSRAISHFYDTLAYNAFGNFKDVLVGTTLTPGMGRYLDMLLNDKPDLSIGRSPNENYAREIKQLFSIGLYRMWPDGTLMLTSKDAPVDTYTQREIVGLSHVFTGWDYGYDGAFRTSFGAAANWTRPMREVPARHYTGTKRVLNNEVLPGLTTLGNQPLDAYSTHLSTQINEAAYQNLPAQELNAVHEMLFNHPNTGPFICRQLIQRLVTSHPSRDYLYRVVQKFNDDGSAQHVRGNMKAVIKAILLDYEARSVGAAVVAGASDFSTLPAYGKQREPIMRIANAARALRPVAVSGNYSQNGTNVISIDTSPTPHLLATGNTLFLEFTDATSGGQPAPSSGTYAVTVTDATHFTINAPGWVTGGYNQVGGQNFITVTISNHYLPGANASYNSANGYPTGLPPANYGQAYFHILTASGPGSALTDGVRTTTSSTSYDAASGVGNVAGTTFTIAAPDTQARSGNLMMGRFPASYSCTGKAGVITIDTGISGTVGANSFGGTASHGLKVGDTVFMNFTNSRDTTSGNETSTENDIPYTIVTVPDPNSFTLTARNADNAAMRSDNLAVVFPMQNQSVVRNGTVNARPSTYVMDNTDSDLQQTPLNSPTVFNFFLPDYKYSGALASQGITTPEFQITSETTAIRQANFFYNGIFNPSNTTGICSFKTGTNALVMDLSPWMGAPPISDVGLGPPADTSVPWTHNQNLPTLIAHLNTLLAAGQMPSAATTIIKNFLSTPITSIGTSLTACQVTTTVPHKLVSGDSVVISGVTGGIYGGGASLNSTTTARVVTVTGPTDGTSTTFTIPLSCSVAPTAAQVATAHVSVISYNQGTTTSIDSLKRDRLRNIIHLILTSPDFTIQR